MPTRQFKTTLKDAEGIEHLYSCASFPSGESADLFLEVMEIVSGPIGHALVILFGGNEETGEMDFSGLPAAFQEIPKMIVAKGGSKLIKRILSNCRRDSGEKDQQGKDIWHHLNNDADFNNVYAGNLMEMFEAVYWVIAEVNYRPFFAVNMIKLSELWNRLGNFTLTEPIPSETKKSEAGS